MIYASDIELVQAMQKGESSAAVNQFTRKYQSFVYSTAYRYLQSRDDAEDIAQEVFIKAFSSIKKFRAEASLKTWLYRITVNMCINAKRKKKFLSIFTTFGEDLEDEGYDKFLRNDQTPEKTFENKEFEENFLKILNKLPEKQRETFVLRYFDELSYEEISNALGTSVGGLKANYFQAVKKLSTMIKAEG